MKTNTLFFNRHFFAVGGSSEKRLGDVSAVRVFWVAILRTRQTAGEFGICTILIFLLYDDTSVELLFHCGASVCVPSGGSRVGAAEGGGAARRWLESEHQGV